MENYLHVDSGHHLPVSPSNSFMADEVASIWPLITPSPPTNDLINPLPEVNQPIFEIGKQLVNKLHHVDDDENKTEVDSASSSSSALAEPACTQLLNHRNNAYHHITKDEEIVAEETTGKLQPLQLTFRNPPENYFFMSWNWPLLRKISLWIFLSSLVAMLGLVIAMIWSLPKKCNPHTEWYQGSVMYEIFPASFHDSNKNMYGDFNGISQKVEYFAKDLGISAVRLNSIFKTDNYPEDYKNITSLVDIATQLGTLDDFKNLKNQLKQQNISLLLDLPLYPFVTQLRPKFNFFSSQTTNQTNPDLSVEFLRMDQPNKDLVEEALLHWTSVGVDGFYLKGLEHLLEDPNFGPSLRNWKKIVGPDRPLIVNESLINNAPKNLINVILNNVDLVDVTLDVQNGQEGVSKQLERLQNGTLFSRPGTPWIQWSLGGENSPRLASILPYQNATLGATLLQLMLPGTPCIFYGNEIGLQQLSDPQGERKDLKHLHHLTPMVWQNNVRKVLPWLHGEATFTNFAQKELISKMINLRSDSPSIYVNSVFKQGENKANADVKYSSEDLLVIQRWYPRRKSYVVASNLGNREVSKDLSTFLYSGEVVIGPAAGSQAGTISFKKISLWPGESVIILLD